MPVSYFGACLHVLLSPANQIIHVFAPNPCETESYVDAVWEEGVIELANTETDLGDFGYRVKAQAVASFDERR